MDRNDQYDIIVIGGGHAGAEAAWAAAGLGATVGLLTMDPNTIGAMSCNPAIGGLAKGQIVREVDALGGLMARAIDATGIQFRILNTSRGAAVHGPRAQADKYAYANEIHRLLKTRPNIDIIRATVDALIVKSGRCIGVRAGDRTFHAESIVLTTGTFMRGLMHTGETQTRGGRIDEPSAEGISRALHELGFEIGRLKTGTPPRLDARTINFDQTKPQHGDDPPRPFSELTPDVLPTQQFPALPQITCHTTYTNQRIHDLIRDNLYRAPMYDGGIQADSGPRYCPSIEDKIVRFADREAHHVFLEPESLDTNEIYCNGISTSLPVDVQDSMVRLMDGCEDARILRYGYAVEYDMVWPHQIDSTCMTKPVAGLFLAGQINGTSGYEEAAGQGLVAGLNAVRFARGEPLARLTRDSSYIGVMLDDLVTKAPREPYRMFTSRAEFRLLLRADNAPDRLTPMGRDLGLVDDQRWQAYLNRSTKLEHIQQAFDETRIGSRSLSELAGSGQADTDEVLSHLQDDHDHRLAEVVFNNCRYASYIKRQTIDNRKIAELEHRRLHHDFDYDQVRGLRNEAVEVLARYKPATFGQAGRLPGVNPADMTLIAVALKGRKNRRKTDTMTDSSDSAI